MPVVSPGSGGMSVVPSGPDGIQLFRQALAGWPNDPSLVELRQGLTEQRA